jgi:tetratricopeptide (TPR) repeat protein
VPEEGILIIGDTFSKSFLPGTSSNVRKVEVALWLEVLDAFLAEPDELKHAVRGHTDIFSREEIAAIRDYMRELWDGISAANAEGLDLEAIQRRFPLSNFSYITKTKNQDETELQRQHQIIVQGFWRQHQNKEFVFEKIMQTAQEMGSNTPAGAKAVLDKYADMVSNQNAYFFHEAVINNNANNFIQMNFLDEAVELLRLHIKIFPESSAAYAILGDAYAGKGEIEQAIKSLKKSLKLDPKNKSVKEKLKKLEKIK